MIKSALLALTLADTAGSTCECFDFLRPAKMKTSLIDMSTVTPVVLTMMVAYTSTQRTRAAPTWVLAVSEFAARTALTTRSRAGSAGISRSE